MRLPVSHRQAGGAAGVFILPSHVLVLDYPRGLLQHPVKLPWPFN